MLEGKGFNGRKGIELVGNVIMGKEKEDGNKEDEK